MSHRTNQYQNQRNSHSKNQRPEKDMFADEDFMFNKTSLLSSALNKLKGSSQSSQKNKFKRPAVQTNEERKEEKPQKKIKKSLEQFGPTLSYTPLQHNIYNFFVINKASIKAQEMVPEPKLTVGSIVLSAICDRGIGGKYLVSNLFRNKKAYLDYTELILNNTNNKKSIEALEKYEQPGDFIIGTVVKSRNATHTQVSLSQELKIDEKTLRIGQTLPAEVKSKEEMGCHLIVKGIKRYKIYLPKHFISEEAFGAIKQCKQVIVVIKEIEELKTLVKVTLVTEQEIALNLKGIEEEEMGKLQLQQYICPGTLLNTKIIKVVENGVFVKFLKIFTGYIHADHLVKNVKSYANDQKLQARVIFLCSNPPAIYLSERHLNLSPYQPSQKLYQAVKKPDSISQIQGSYFNQSQEFFAHPLQLHSEFANLNKFWVKQYNYFQKYNICSSKKIGVKVGDVAKQVPFNNFKIYGEGEGKFRVLCLDVWNKVIKISYDKKILVAQNLLFDSNEYDEDKKYCGFVSNLNPAGVVVEFCNNIKGIISRKELETNGVNINQHSIGSAIQLYIANNKKGYLGLSLTPISLRKPKIDKPQETNLDPSAAKDQTLMGIIQTISTGSIHPIYIQINHQIVKINVFTGIRPPSLQDLHILQNLEQHFQVGQRVKVFKKKSQYFLYPPEQLSDKNLRFCKITGVHHSSTLRVQVGRQDFRNCHICDITDIICSHPFSEYKVGQMTVGRVIDEKSICLRKSLVMNGFPKNIKEVLERFGEQEKKGDYRNRVETVGSASLKVDTVTFGYIKNYTEKGCFISIARNLDIRVEISELSDHFIPNKDSVFRKNKIVLCRLINSKVKQGEANSLLFDGSLRQSVVKLGYPLNDEILANGIGLTVTGVVTSYVKGKALVRLNSSKFTGIIGLHDIEGGEESTLEKLLPIGHEVECKITEYSKEGERRLIRLSNKAKTFQKYKEFTTTFQPNPKIIALWDNFKHLESIEPIQEEMPEELLQPSEDAEYNRLKQLLAQNDVQTHQNSQKKNNSLEKEKSQQDQSEADQEQDSKSQIDQEIQEEEMEEEKYQGPERIGKVELQNLSKKVELFEKMPHSPSFYQSLILANPTPESHLMYISSILNTSTPEMIRAQFVRAISSLTNIKDKDNMWISWLNMELILGDLIGTVKKAIQANVGIIVHFRILQILADQENWEIALEYGKKMLKKFNRDPEAYVAFLKLVTRYSLSHKVPESLTPKEIFKRASQCLKSTEIIQIETQYGKSIFELGEYEKARNVFEDLITKHPKRTDLWSVYVDLEIKHASIDRARSILERALTLNLKKKQTVSLIKKYYQIEKTHGTEAKANSILERAKNIAEKYQDQNDLEEEDIEDIQ